MRSIVQPAALVEARLDTLLPEQRAIALALSEATLAADTTLVRVIKWGNLMFMHRGLHAVARARVVRLGSGLSRSAVR